MSDLTTKAAEIRAGLVKPLEWRDAGFAACASVSTLGLTYVLQNGRDGWFGAVTGAGISIYLEGTFAAVDEAKAAAQSDYEARILSALATPPSPATVADGWVLVPKEPDDAMSEAAWDALQDGKEWGRQISGYDVWRAMLAVAPSPALENGHE